MGRCRGFGSVTDPHRWSWEAGGKSFIPLRKGEMSCSEYTQRCSSRRRAKTGSSSNAPLVRGLQRCTPHLRPRSLVEPRKAALFPSRSYIRATRPEIDSLFSEIFLTFSIQECNWKSWKTRQRRAFFCNFGKAIESVKPGERFQTHRFRHSKSVSWLNWRIPEGACSRKLLWKLPLRLTTLRTRAPRVKVLRNSLRYVYFGDNRGQSRLLQCDCTNVLFQKSREIAVSRFSDELRALEWRATRVEKFLSQKLQYLLTISSEYI